MVFFTTYEASVGQALEAVGAAQVLRRQRAILIKPNLVTADGHPVTTHPDCCAAVIGLNRHRNPDLTLLDARIGLAEYHLGGPWCDPPVNRLVAGFDPVAVDRQAARLLGLDWRAIVHLQDAGRSAE